MKTNTEKELKREIEGLDKEIHKKSPSKCPKCGVRLYSYKAIENHVKKFKHYGNYNKYMHITPKDTGYLYEEYKLKKAKLEGYRKAKEEFNKFIKEVLDEIKWIKNEWLYREIRKIITKKAGKELE